jgi:Zn-dependent peptidase ImmA (M78 family)/transcriptional regulator with XRE-family HTH domain
MSLSHTQDAVKLVFGEEGEPAQLAQKSTRTYVRGLDQLAQYTEGAKGRQLTASEALDAYGLAVLAEVAAEGSALICAATDAAGSVLRQRRDELGLDIRHVARQANVGADIVEAAEASKRLSIRDYERIARVLGLDERFLSVRSEPEGNERIAVRLRTVGRNESYMSQSTVVALAEAAWVAMCQSRLERELNLVPEPVDIRPDSYYGGPGSPAFERGYELAQHARSKLGLGQEPIKSMRDLCESTLGLPIIQAPLGNDVAGATIEVDGQRRAVVVNLDGHNRNPYIRRATVAHELGHVLYDPPSRLNNLRVDAYADLDRDVAQVRDPVEQRANAFAVEFLAPQAAAIARYRESPQDGLAAVMHTFGVSFTTARYQLWNGLNRTVSLDELRSDNLRWMSNVEAEESYTVDYHPIVGIRPARAGRFSAVVVRAASERRISWDTAAEWLITTPAAAQRAAPNILALFPGVGRSSH